MEPTLTKLEAALLVLINRHRNITQSIITRRQPEKGIMKRRLGESPDAFRRRRFKRRIDALDKLVLAGLVRRMVQMAGRPGPAPTIYQMTATGRAFMKRHGNGQSLIVAG